MRFLPLLLCAGLIACVPAAKPPSALSVPADTNVRLHQLSTTFLYLAAQKAVREGQLDAAISLLTALVQKDGKAPNPRLQLAELLLLRNKGKLALKHIDAVLLQGKIDKVRKPSISMLRARALATTGQKQQAMRVLKELLGEHPRLLQPRLMLIRLYTETNNTEAAHEIIRQSIAVKDNAGLRQLQAQLYIRENQFRKAQKALEAMRKLVPDNETPVLLLYNLDKSQGDTAAAEQVLRGFLARHPNALRISTTLGSLLTKQKRIDEAIAVYEELAKKTHADVRILTALGLLYYQEDNFKKAAVLFRQVLLTNPNTVVRFYLAASLEAGGKEAEAARMYARFNPKEPAYVEAQLRLANMAFEQNKLQKAARRLLTIISKQPAAARAYSMLSAVRLAQGKYRRVIEETAPAITMQDVPIRLLFNRAAAFEHLRDYVRAETHLKRLLKIDPEHADALNFLGYLYAETGTNLDKAGLLINRALKLKPNDGYYLDSLAWVYFKRGDYAEALNAQRKAIKQVADDPVMREHLGDILWRNGRMEEARQEWNQAIKLKHTEPAELRQKISKGL